MGDLMQKALQKISVFKGKLIADELEAQFKYVQRMSGGNRIFERILKTNQKNQIDDCLAEIKYALIFVGLGFQTRIGPFGRKKGPDLEISRNNNHAFVEITRFNKQFPGPPELDHSLVDPILQVYGNPNGDVEKSIKKIKSKFGQVLQVPDDNAIIAIWNDDGDLDEIHVRIAVNDMQRVAYEGKISLPPNLSFILYGSNWINLRNKQQLYCFPIGNQEPFILEWQKELEKSVVSNLLQRVIE